MGLVQDLHAAGKLPEMHSTGVQCPFYSGNKSNTNAGEKTPPDMGQPGRGNPGLEGARH